MRCNARLVLKERSTNRIDSICERGSILTDSICRAKKFVREKLENLLGYLMLLEVLRVTWSA